MSLANKLSLFRILLVPAFVFCLLSYGERGADILRYAAVLIFTVAVITDAVDGYIARVEKQATRLGAILDPLADKLLLVSAFLSLSLMRSLPDPYRLPAWVPLVVLSRDALIVFGWLLVVLLTGDYQAQPRPSRLGKITTFFQMFTIVSVLLGWPFSGWVLWVAMVLTALSGIGYIRQGNRLLNFSHGVNGR
ncbi:MAG: CDP-alcohol phosphatidyltransferase family protein [Candidatus Omnitrophica bacterium]|nr:CDP-alcohol phosphatidyltransferase family protein [Candidatus Omnitrophota bacterium]